MTNKQIETSREARLWLGQIIGPACIMAAMIVGNPEARNFVADKAKVVKNFVKNKFRKKTES